MTEKNKVLYIEDNQANAHLMENIFKVLGESYELFIAYDGHSGLEQAEKIQPDLILLDIQLPGLDGYQVLDNLKEDPELANIPVYAITANAMLEHQQRINEVGFDKLILKPLNVKEFIETVENSFANS